MKATFDPRNPDVHRDIRDFVAKITSAYSTKFKTRPKYITVSPAMRTLITSAYSQMKVDFRRGRAPNIIGMPVRVNAKMQGYTLCINHRGPLSDRTKANNRTRSTVRRRVKRAINADPWGKRGINKLMGMREISPGVFEADVSVMMPMNHITVEIKNCV